MSKTDLELIAIHAVMKTVSDQRALRDDSVFSQAGLTYDEGCECLDRNYGKTGLEFQTRDGDLYIRGLKNDD